MMYAFARDGGIPGHKFFHKVDAKRKSPVRTGQSCLTVPVSTMFYSRTYVTFSVARMLPELLSRPPMFR